MVAPQGNGFARQSVGRANVSVTKLVLTYVPNEFAALDIAEVRFRK